MIRLRAVGECVIDVGGERVGPDAELAFALLLVLTLSEGRPLGRRQLIDLLWPATTEARARHNLRQALYKLRQLGVPVETESNRLRLPAAAIAPNVLLEPELEGPPPAELLRPDVPFGEFLAGYAPAFSAAFAAWVDEQRGVMHGRLRRAVLSLLLDERRRGNWGAVETLARKCLQLDPLNEEATLALAEATALSGSKRAALAILDGYLHELGGSAGDIRLPATVLRRRIAERLHPTNSYVLGESCFLGRAESIAFLNEHYRDCRVHGGRAVLLWGDAGIGKSRLLTEFGRIATLEGAQVVRVGCQARDVERPLSIFVDAVPLIMALPGALGIAPESMEYLRRLTAHDPAVLEPSAATREAELLFASVRRAVFDLIDAVAAEAPLLLCFEDLQWLDDQSWRVLRELIGWLDGRPVLVALSSRLPHATPAPPAREVPGLEAHRVVPLDQASSVALLDAITAGTEPPPAFRDWSIQVADGNPLLLRLLGGHWLEKGQMRAPASIERLISDRLIGLNQTALRTLHAIAILGKNATHSRIEHILRFKRCDILDAISTLDDRGLLSRTSSAIPCKHEIIASAALKHLPELTKRILHRAAALLLQSEIERAADASLLWACAQHWQLAGERDQALKVIRSCASHLLGVGLAVDALGILELAVDLCESDAERADMLFRAAEAGRLCGQWQRVVDALQARANILRDREHPGDEPAEPLRLEAAWRCDHALAPLLCSALHYAKNPIVLPPYRARAGVLALIFADNLCDRSAARQAFDTVCALRAFRGERDVSEQQHLASLVYHSSYGELATAVAEAYTVIELAKQSNDLAEQIRAVSRASIPLRRSGAHAEAIALVREALDVAEQHRLISAACSAADILATIHLEREELDVAQFWYGRALHWLREQEGAAAVGSVSYIGARLAIRFGRIDEAHEIIPASLAATTTDQNVRRRNEALAVYLDVALARDTDCVNEAALAALTEGHVQARGHGGQDYPTWVLSRCLLSVQEEARARLFLQEYVGVHRRETSPLPSYLGSLLNQLTASL